MILVTGATGHLGPMIIRSLLKTVPANQIVAAVRNPQKAESLKALGVQVRVADYDDAHSWEKVFTGIDKLMLVSGSEVGKRFQQHKNVLEAAKKYGHLKLIVYTSLLRADTSNLVLAEEHRQTEELIKASGIPYSILRNGWYTENYVQSAKSAVEHGAVFGAVKEGRISSAPRKDYAEAAAKVLTMENPKPLYELAGDESYTLSDLAKEISKQTGKDVKYTDLSETDYKALLVKVGLPEPFAGVLAQSDVAASKGGLYDETHDLSHLLGRKTTPMKETLPEFLN